MQIAPIAPETDETLHRAGVEDDDRRSTRLVDDELVIEEISIDGMCGVY